MIASLRLKAADSMSVTLTNVDTGERKCLMFNLTIVIIDAFVEHLRSTNYGTYCKR